MSIDVKRNKRQETHITRADIFPLNKSIIDNFQQQLSYVCDLSTAYGKACSLEVKVKIILYVDTDRIRESSFREEGSITKIDNVQ